MSIERNIEINVQGEFLKLGKFVDGSAIAVWHGYPADYQRRPQILPAISVVQVWVTKGLIRKHQRVAPFALSATTCDVFVNEDAIWRDIRGAVWNSTGRRSGKKTAAEDAAHIAIAVNNGTRYIATWNSRQIANASMRSQIERACRQSEYVPPIICTPSELVELDHEGTSG